MLSPHHQQLLRIMLTSWITGEIIALQWIFFGSTTFSVSRFLTSIPFGLFLGFIIYLGRIFKQRSRETFDHILEKLGYYTTIMDPLATYTLLEHSKNTILNTNQIRTVRNYTTYKNIVPRPFMLHRFDIGVRYTKKKYEYYPFIAFEFQLQDPHPNVLACDTRHTVQGNPHHLRTLESGEFNAAFHVYAKDPKAPFYFFDPDTMADLTDIRNTLPYSLYIEVSGEGLLIAIALGSIIDTFHSSLTLKERLTGQYTPEHTAQFAQKIDALDDIALHIFKTLDYSYKKYNT